MPPSVDPPPPSLGRTRECTTPMHAVSAIYPSHRLTAPLPTAADPALFSQNAFFPFRALARRTELRAARRAHTAAPQNPSALLHAVLASPGRLARAAHAQLQHSTRQAEQSFWVPGLCRCRPGERQRFTLGRRRAIHESWLQVSSTGRAPHAMGWCARAGVPGAEPGRQARAGSCRRRPAPAAGAALSRHAAADEGRHLSAPALVQRCSSRRGTQGHRGVSGLCFNTRFSQTARLSQTAAL